MKKIFDITIFFFIIGVVFVNPAWSIHEKTAESRIEDLSKRIEALESKTMEDESFVPWFKRISAVCWKRKRGMKDMILMHLTRIVKNRVILF